MRVSRAQAEENHQAVITAAGRLFREHGFNGIGLNDLMKAAGLTRGGFYKQFKSKEDLAIQASHRALEGNVSKWSKILESTDSNPLATLIGFYLSASHRDCTGEGCALAALGADTARNEPALRRTFETSIKAHLDVLDGLASSVSDAPTRDTSIPILSAMLGALLLSRVVTDEALSQRILDVTAQDLIDRLIADRGRSVQ